ncbi:MAG: methyltransferase domain-containing protein [Chitinophagaceae bacterium]|nr:methyltransferase domain-containing protein [Chitinophagaceae bacterium]
MKLLSDKELNWSDIVANNRMNRSRNASGVNSYEQELKLRPEKLLHAFIERNGKVKWLDLCCGEGRALIQAAEWLAEKKIQDQAQLIGIDLVDQFHPVPEPVSCLRFEVMALAGWMPSDRYDIITCIHGLHYLGDKLSLLAAACSSLTEDGVLMANLDLNSIRVEKDVKAQYLRKVLKEHQIDYKARSKMIFCKGPRQLTFQLDYLGADDRAGANYTGQPAVDSWYRMIK